MSVLRDVLFGQQKQSARQMEVVEEFVHDYIERKYPGVTDWNDLSSVDQSIGSVLEDLMELLQYPSSFPGDENYAAPEDWLFARLFLGYEAVDDVCENRDCMFTIGSQTQENGKIVYHAWMSEDEAGEQLEEDVPKLLDTSEADAIVDKVISSCPPSEREKLPADDKLAAVLLSRSYWQGQLG